MTIEDKLNLYIHYMLKISEYALFAGRVNGVLKYGNNDTWREGLQAAMDDLNTKLEEIKNETVH